MARRGAIMTKLACLLSVAALVSLNVQAAATRNRQAQERVADFKKDHATLLAKVPGLLPIDAVVRDDCAAQNEGKLATDDYCSCAAAITMGLWRSGMDPNMAARLKAYLNNPTDGGAKEFLKYQGPELYRPLCGQASNR
jgi:hypothetical protein